MRQTRETYLRKNRDCYLPFTLPEEYDQLFKQTQAGHHKFVYDKEATAKAMKGLLSSMRYESEAL